MITLVHFNLRDSIMVGKKKTQDVQARYPHACPVVHASLVALASQHLRA